MIVGICSVIGYFVDTNFNVLHLRCKWSGRRNAVALDFLYYSLKFDSAFRVWNSGSMR